MGSVNRKYIIALVIVISFAIAMLVMNPHKKYSRRNFWQEATLSSVKEVPQEALKYGNKNGSVLMWAATAVSDPNIITALIERGADVNERNRQGETALDLAKKLKNQVAIVALTNMLEVGNQ